MSEGQVTIVVGASGVGKTAGRVQWLLDEFLTRPHLGTLVTNIPLRVERIRQHYDALHKQGKNEQTGDEVAARICVIPDDWRAGWVRRDPAYEPAKCIEGLEGAYRVVLDECQFYFGADSPIEWQMRFIEFINTARHGGGRVELMTQTFDGIPAKVRSSAEVEITTLSAKVKRDGWINVPLSEWYNLRAAIVRRWASAVWFIEHINVGGRKRQENNVTRYVLDDWIFEFYGSNDAVEGSEKSGRIPEDWEQYSRGQMIRRFIGRHWGKMLFSRATALVVLLYLALGGPMSWALSSAFASFPGYVETAVKDSMAKKGLAKTETKPDGRDVASSPLPQGLAVTDDPWPVVEGPSVSNELELMTINGVWIHGNFWGVGEQLPDGATIESIDLLRGRCVTDRGLLLLAQSSGKASGVEKRVRENADGNDRSAEDSERVGAIGGIRGVGDSP